MRKPELAGSWEGGLELFQKSFPQVLPCGVQSEPKLNRVLWVLRSSHVFWPFTRVVQDLGAKVILKKIINHLHFTVKFVKLD